MIADKNVSRKVDIYKQKRVKIRNFNKTVLKYPAVCYYISPILH